MERIIEISNIKHISEMTFKLPNKPGVYVLTGINGSGKTTLMTCLLRIGQTRAFPDNFKTGNDKLDTYEGEIKYKIINNGLEESVTYHHTGVRWPPNPRKNSDILKKFGYPEVRFLPATGNRLYVNDEAIETHKVYNVEKEFIEDLNMVFSTNKFSDIKYIQTGSLRGPGGGSQRWKRAYVIKKKSKTYYSEKNFSLGEILVLNTLLLIQDVAKGSMLLIDELEMALHPKVQKKLLELLEIKAVEKELTIIFSTHSSSLIKCSKRLIYLDNDSSGKIKVYYDCYPAVVLREVAIEEDSQPDYLFTVEDDMAEMLLRKILDYYFQKMSSKPKLIYKIIPIGGYSNLLDFAQNTSNYLFSNKIGQYIFFDADVKEVKQNIVGKGNKRSKEETEIFNLFIKFENKYKFLPITPELGVWDWINSNMKSFERDFNDEYISTVDILEVITETEKIFKNTPETDTGEKRKKAKRRVKNLVKVLSDKSNVDDTRITNFMFSQFVDWYYSSSTSNSNELKATFGKIFNSRRN